MTDHQEPGQRSHWTEDRIRNALAGAQAPKPPSHLQQRLLGQIPRHQANQQEHRRRRWGLWVGAAAAACLLAAGGLWLQIQREPREHPLDSDITAVALPPAVSSLAVGDSRVNEHVSLLLDARTVLVLWSWQAGPASTDALYQETILSEGIDEKGKKWRWSLFRARPGIEALAQPPGLRVGSGQFGAVRLSVTPRRCPGASPDALKQCLNHYPSLPLERIKTLLL